MTSSIYRLGLRDNYEFVVKNVDDLVYVEVTEAGTLIIPPLKLITREGRILKSGVLIDSDESRCLVYRASAPERDFLDEVLAPVGIIQDVDIDGDTFRLFYATRVVPWLIDESEVMRGSRGSIMRIDHAIIEGGYTVPQAFLLQGKETYGIFFRQHLLDQLESHGVLAAFEPRRVGEVRA